MAIAPLPQIEELTGSDLPWPRPRLTLVGASSTRIGESLEHSEVLRISPRPSGIEHRALRVSRRTRRRRMAGLLVGATVAIVLALPLTATGTVTISGQPTPGGTPAGLMDGTDYIVHEGDTLASIAHHLNPGGNQGALIATMRHEVGSSVVVPGEHLVLP